MVIKTLLFFLNYKRLLKTYEKEVPKKEHLSSDNYSSLSLENY